MVVSLVYVQVRFDVETYGQMDYVPVGEDERIDQSGTLGGIEMGWICFNPAAERRR